MPAECFQIFLSQKLPKDYARPALNKVMELTDEDVKKIANTYHAWRGEKNAGEYADSPGFCKSATIEEIQKQNYVLTPGRYVGAQEQEEDGEPFEEKMKRLVSEWKAQQKEASRLDAQIAANLKGLGYGL